MKFYIWLKYFILCVRTILERAYLKMNHSGSKSNSPFHFDESAEVIQQLAEELYEKYSPKDHPQSFYLKFNYTIDDKPIRLGSEAMGSIIYIKQVGKNHYVYKSFYEYPSYDEY